MEIPVEKNKEYIVEIIDNGFSGEGIAKIECYTIFVPNAIKGEKVKILILKVLSSHAFAKVLEILESSDIRQNVDCASYERCGGCNLRHISYKATLDIKRNNVQNLANKFLNGSIQIDEVIGMGNPYFYRNKAIYPVRKKQTWKSNLRDICK